MRFLADESCDFAVVRALRAAGHDVLAVAEAARGARDPVVMALARDGLGNPRLFEEAEEAGTDVP